MRKVTARLDIAANLMTFVDDAGSPVASIAAVLYRREWVDLCLTVLNGGVAAELDVASTYALIAKDPDELRVDPDALLSAHTYLWADDTEFAKYAIVYHGDAGYRALQAHTSVAATSEPGVGASWEDYWEPSAAHAPATGKLQFSVNCNSAPLISYLLTGLSAPITFASIRRGRGKVVRCDITRTDTNDAEDLILAAGDIGIVLDVRAGTETAPLYYPGVPHVIREGAPTVDDDANDGFAVRSTWFDAEDGALYICHDATPGAAVWVALSTTDVAAELAAYLKLSGGTLSGDIDANSVARLLNLKGLTLRTATALPVNGGAITPTGPIHAVDTEGAAATDELTTIDTYTGILFLYLVNAARVVSMTHGTAPGQIEIRNGQAIPLTRGLTMLYRQTVDDSWAVLAGTVDTVFGRTGTILPVAGDYAATQVSNDSGVAGAWVAAALDTLDGMFADYLALTGNTMAGAINMANHAISHLPEPTAAHHPATRAWVEALFQGLDPQDGVLSMDLTAPPAEPTAGDRYIVATDATGDWTGEDDHIAQWSGSAWTFTIPTTGAFLPVEELDKLYYYSSAGHWQPLGSTIDHGGLLGLGDDDHDQYALLAGRAGDRLILPDHAATPPLRMTARATAPSTPGTGDIYLDSGANTASGLPGLRRWSGSAWVDLGAAAGGGGGTEIDMSDLDETHDGQLVQYHASLLYGLEYPEFTVGLYMELDNDYSDTLGRHTQSGTSGTFVTRSWTVGTHSWSGASSQGATITNNHNDFWFATGDDFFISLLLECPTGAGQWSLEYMDTDLMAMWSLYIDVSPDFGSMMFGPNMAYGLTQGAGADYVLHTDQPNRIEMTRTSGTLKVFVNGDEVYSVADSFEWGLAVEHDYGGYTNDMSSFAWSGSGVTIDELAVAKGVGWHTAAYDATGLDQEIGVGPYRVDPDSEGADALWPASKIAAELATKADGIIGDIIDDTRIRSDLVWSSGLLSKKTIAGTSDDITFADRGAVLQVDTVPTYDNPKYPGGGTRWEFENNFDDWSGNNSRVPDATSGTGYSFELVNHEDKSGDYSLKVNTWEAGFTTLTWNDFTANWPAAIGTGDFTIDFWARGDFSIWLGDIYISTSGEWGDEPRTLAFGKTGSGASASDLGTWAKASTDFQHFALERRTGVLRVSRNGVVSATTVAAADDLATPALKLQCARYGAAAYYDDLIVVSGTHNRLYNDDFDVPWINPRYVVSEYSTENVGETSKWLATYAVAMEYAEAAGYPTIVSRTDDTALINTNGGFVKLDSSAGAFTLTLPAAASMAKRTLVFKKITSDANDVTIDGDGAETIDGAATLVISAQYETVTLISDGTQWWVR